MSHDRPPHPVRAFLARFFGVSRNRSRESTASRLSSRNDSAHRVPVGAISYAVAQQPSAIMIASASGARQWDHLTVPPPFVPPPPPSPSRKLLGDVPTASVYPAPIRREISLPVTLPQKTSSTQGPSPPQTIGTGLFNQASNFVIHDSTFVDNGSDNFMNSFLQETIIGAEFDSSDPNMPQRCHPGTRVEIIERCQEFVLNREGRPKLRWVVGAAGVGKSAIMQSVAYDEDKILEDIIVGATIFFSVNGRQDGTKTIKTIAYQLAVKLDPYRRFVQREVTRNPSLLHKSLSTQFTKFIVEPFIHECILDPSSCLLIIIDGLDECANPLTQRELLGLISVFCITYPTSPIVWIIASRPEPHISSFFYHPKLTLPYEKEEIWIDSDDAVEDVQLYLRDKFKEIQMASITLRYLPQWPSEGDFSKIAEASGGLFAYASTVVRYISDPTYGDPVGQLEDVLEIIETGTNPDGSEDDHPFAQLDALYARILSRIPAKVMANTRKLLLLYGRGVGWLDPSFRFSCNMLGMTEHAAYGATHNIHSIASVPGPYQAKKNGINYLHKSFYDYLEDFKRSGFSPNFRSEAHQLRVQCALRILEQAPDGVYIDGASESDLKMFDSGFWRNGPGTGDNISISWPAVGEDKNRKLRLEMFRAAVWAAMLKVEASCSPPYLRILTTCFTRLPTYHTYTEDLAVTIFHESRRRELLDHGILKQVPLGILDYARTRHEALLRLHFRGHTGVLFDPWNASCDHEREGNWGDDIQDWSMNYMQSGSCDYCYQRFFQQFKMRLPGDIVTIYNLDLTTCAAELRFVDPDDGVSEWTYHFLAKYKVGDEGSETSGDK